MSFLQSNVDLKGLEWCFTYLHGTKFVHQRTSLTWWKTLIVLLIIDIWHNGTLVAKFVICYLPTLRTRSMNRAASIVVFCLGGCSYWKWIPIVFKESQSAYSFLEVGRDSSHDCWGASLLKQPIFCTNQVHQNRCQNDNQPANAIQHVFERNGCYIQQTYHLLAS